MPEASGPRRLLMNRGEFSDLRLETLDATPGAGSGEAVFRLHRFALTFNNITYATYGDVLRYWQFFPVDGQYGLLPVWGYADVIDSAVDGIEPGQRFYGYWPLATHATLEPGRIGAHSFRDDAAHRADLPEIYNWYQRTDDDAFHDAASEPLHAIYRPLFITAFCLADFLAENDFFGAGRVAVSSASSKTGYATAFCIRQRSNIDRDIEMAGLTSGGNREFVQRLGLYDTVAGYDSLAEFHPNTPTLYIDIAGNPELQARVHRHFGASLVFDASVGSAQSLAPPVPDRELPGPKPEFFFAPTWIAKRHADWGVAGFNRRAGEATAAFFKYVTDNRLVELVESRGLEAAREVIVGMIEGRTDPRKGQVIVLE
ncbi:MAG: DUF2855 family protein [Wenzhouxiangellaceae bacterium]|nr:DUF2855 family protein [Wenzhouxiangellaceae bacterium]